MTIYLWVFLFTITASVAQGQNVRVTFVEDGVHLYEGNGTTHGCYLNLGCFPYWCPGNVSLCQGGVTVAAWVKSHSDVKPELEPQMMLSSGGQGGAMNDGFYIERRLVDQYTVGVALADKLWRTSFRLEAGTWSLVVFTWEKTEGLSLYVDGIFQTRVKDPESRTPVSTSGGGSSCLVTGLTEYQEPVITSCSYDIGDVTVVISKNVSIAMASQTNLTQTMYVGCTVANVNSTVLDATNTDPITTCRLRCAQVPSTYAMIANGSRCACANNVSAISLTHCDNLWSVYYVTHIKTSHAYMLSLDAASQNKRNYTKPGEDVVFNARVGVTIPVLYTFAFDDGVVVTTLSPSVSHSWSAAGQHSVAVTAQIGIIILNSSLLFNVQDVDEGEAPDLVGLTGEQGSTSFTAQFNLSVIDEHPSSCSLAYGDGKISPGYQMMDFSSEALSAHTYDRCGLYNVNASCGNAYGTSWVTLAFWSRDLQTANEYSPPDKNYTVDVFGDFSFFSRLDVSINNVSADVSVIDAKAIRVDSRDISEGSDSLICLVSDDVVLHQHIVYTRSLLDMPVLTADKTAGAWNLTVKLTVTLSDGDHVWLTIDYGNGAVKTFFIPAITGVMRIDDTMFYGLLGDYVIKVTASNEVSTVSSEMDISVQIPVFDITIRSHNITSLQQNAAFELRLNSGQAIPKYVSINIVISFGDGTVDQFVFQMADQNYLGSYIANHTYATWGIYNVKVTAANNISQDEDHTLIQVGENITFVDITAVQERMKVGDKLELNILCPTGSNVRYRLDFGDGSTFTFWELSASFPTANGSEVSIVTEASATVTHIYSRAGVYRVKVDASNEFGSVAADLCAGIVVADPITQQVCSAPTLSFRNIQTSLDKPLVSKRSATTLLPVDASTSCSGGLKPNITYSWKSTALEKGFGKMVERTVNTFCASKQMDNTLQITPLSLSFGLYKFTVTVSPSGYDLNYNSDSVYVQIVQSDPVAVIAGDPVHTIMLYANAIFDISGCYDPDLETDVRKDLTFYLFFMSESLLKANQKQPLSNLIENADLLTNRTLFRSTTANPFNMYQLGICFNDTVKLNNDLSTFGGKVTFAAENFASNQFSLAVMLWVERNGLSSMTYQIVEIRSSNASLDDLGSLLDLAKNADPDTAIRLLGGAASAILNQDTSTAEAQQKLAESTEAVVNTLSTVAKRIDSPTQASKCASAIKTMTSNKDIVNEGSRSSAAGAFIVLANGTSNMPEATVEDASSFAGECLGGLGNIFPTSQASVKQPSISATSSPALETTTQLLNILTTRLANASTSSSNNIAFYSTPLSQRPTNTRSPGSTAAPTTSAPLATKATTPLATTVTVVTTPMTTIVHTTVGTTLTPSVGASFSNNGDNFTISGITIGTLQLNASKDYTTPRPYMATTVGTSTAPQTPVPTVTIPIDDRMFEPRTDPRSPYQIALELLHKLPSKNTYNELFSYIFNDCLLFRQVMKSDVIQFNIPCLSTDAINMMKCDGDFTLQDRVFDIITYYEHPDDIYEVYLVPLNNARDARDRARKATDKTVANSGLEALSTIADSIGNKTKEDNPTERSFATPRLGMKVAKISVDNSTNGTDSSNTTQAMTLPTGGFDVPKSIFQGPAAGCSNVNTMFLADTDNPFTFSEQDTNVGKGVLSLSYSCNGEKLIVEGTQEPIVLWMERDASVYEESLFMLLTNTKTEVWTNFNYHPVNLTDFNSSLQVVLEPQDVNSEYYVYMKYGDRPNLTYYDYMSYSPNNEAKQVPGYDLLNDTQKQQLRYTVTFPLSLTTSNGTYWVAVRYKRGNIQLDQTNANSSYSLLNLISGCRFWDDANNSWSSEGCEVGPLTTKYRTQCLCNHLTSFGTDAVVAPNTIDFNNVWAKFANLNENAAVFATVIALIGLYVVLLIVLRYLDKQDLVKWGAIPLEDNLPTDGYFYQVTVQTGVKRNAGTDSQVRFIVSGEDGDTGVRRLTVAEGKRKHLATGSIYNYVMSVDTCLGPLNFLRIWHDNSGKGKNQSWYLDQVQINDLQTGERFIFLCDRWLAVEEDDGLVDRILPVAGLDDLIAFKQLFSSSARKKLANDHLWVSVFSRPTRSNFTRVQRLSCCMSLLFLTMITNAMWFKGAETQTNVEAIHIGPLTFTLSQLFISFASTIIVFPPSFLMITFFRKCEPKKNVVSQANQPMVKDNRKFRWRNFSSSASMIWGSKPKESRLRRLRENISNIFSSIKGNKYEDADLGNTERNDGSQILRPKKKKPFTFPHWCIYIAWALCFFSIVASGFFTILYSMEWGRDKANQWLTTFLLSFFESVIIIQPIKVLLLVAFIACVLKKPDLEEEDLDEDIQRVLAGKELNNGKDEASLSQIMLQRRSDNAEFQPPDPELLSRLRETRMMEIKMEAVLKEIAVYMIFLAIIFFLSYQQRDPQSYYYNSNVRGTLLNNFDQIVTIQDYWGWLADNFMPNFYALNYANKTEIRYWGDAACISDMESRRVGVARIRQLRIKNNTCSIQKEMRSVINHCRDEYGWSADDTKPYLPFWVTPPDAMKDELKDSKTPFVYQDAVDLRTAPFVGNIATYKGGGYVILTKRTYGRTAVLLEQAKSENWIDVNTKAIFLEYTIYNPNVNLFTSVTALVEFLPIGSVVTMADVKVFRLMSYIGGFGVIVLVFEIFFAIVSIVFFVQCIKKLRLQRLAYFSDFWNILEFVLLCLAVTCIVLYAFKHILTDVALSALQDRKSDGFVNFNTIALYDELYCFVMAVVVYLATIQFLRLLQFNKKMGMLGATVKLASRDLYLFSITFFLYFFAFTATGFLLFSSQLTSYQNVVSTAEAMFAFALGSFDFHELSAAQPFWGPLFVFTYIGVVYIGLMSIFLTIIGEAFTEVKENVKLQSNDYELVEFIWGKVKALFK